MRKVASHPTMQGVAVHTTSALFDRVDVGVGIVVDGQMHLLKAFTYIMCALLEL